MASDNKTKTKTEAAPKSAPKPEAATAKTSAVAEPAKAEVKPDAGEKTAAAPAGYSRGEGQKPVSKAYKDNWNAIYGKKTKKK
jgi:hypothetical protein